MKEWDYVKLVFKTGHVVRFGKCKIGSVSLSDDKVIICDDGEHFYFNKNDVIYISCCDMERGEE